MTKSDFVLECIDRVFSVSVAGNFNIENYGNINNLNFYSTLFNNYVMLSGFYDSQSYNREICEDEFDVRLLTAICISRKMNLEIYLSSLSEIVKEHKIDYDVKENYNKLSQQNKYNGKISDLFNKMLMDIREQEEV